MLHYFLLFIGEVYSKGINFRLLSSIKSALKNQLLAPFFCWWNWTNTDDVTWAIKHGVPEFNPDAGTDTRSLQAVTVLLIGFSMWVQFSLDTIFGQPCSELKSVTSQASPTSVVTGYNFIGTFNSEEMNSLVSGAYVILLL